MAQELPDLPPKPVPFPVPVVLHLLLLFAVVEVVVIVVVVVVVVMVEEEVRLLELADHPSIPFNTWNPRQIHLMEPRSIEHLPVVVVVVVVVDLVIPDDVVFLLPERHLPRPDLSAAAESRVTMATPDRTHPIKVGVHRTPIRLLLSIIDRFLRWNNKLLELAREFYRLRQIFLPVDQSNSIRVQLIVRREEDKGLKVGNVFLAKNSRSKVGDFIFR